MKKILITAGSTFCEIDKVRIISNIFKGRTGSTIANYLYNKGHQVDLLTSNTDLFPLPKVNKIIKYKTYNELYDSIEELICNNNYDVIIHSAAVSDYKVKAVYDSCNSQIDIRQGKISSKLDNMYIHLVPTRKIIDDIRELWNFNGKLVKFKLQVDISDDKLIEIAKKSREHSKADIIVANCLEWSKEKAYIITEKSVEKISRINLPLKLGELL